MNRGLVVRIFSLAIILMLVTTPSVRVSAQANAWTEKHFESYYFDNFVDCLNGGEGEWVFLEGQVEVLVHETVDPTGGVHNYISTRPVDLTGYGETTGTVYHLVGISRMGGTIESWEEFFPNVGTYVDNYRMIAPGSGNNFTVHMITHMRVDENGEIVVSVDHQSVECR